jgi:putative SOS response-associated peptidase YedK
LRAIGSGVSEPNRRLTEHKEQGDEGPYSFYEWTGEKGAKQPHLFTAADGSPVLAFAGQWDRWRDRATREEILSCTIIVSDASAWMEPYHDRMPVLLQEADFDAWLDVSPRLNRTGVGDDDPTIIEPTKR